MAPQLLARASGGYLSFGAAIPSNHRAIWIDLHLLWICPCHQEAHVKPLACRLKCSDPHVVEWYNLALAEILNKHDIPQRLSNLDTILQHPSDLQCCYRIELNAINNIIMEAKWGAENQCHKFKSGQVQWCPRVTMAINKILFWKSILKQDSGSKVGLSILSCGQKMWD